jgi:hypothetical protein
MDVLAAAAVLLVEDGEDEVGHSVTPPDTHGAAVESVLKLDPADLGSSVIEVENGVVGEVVASPLSPSAAAKPRSPKSEELDVVSPSPSPTKRTGSPTKARVRSKGKKFNPLLVLDPVEVPLWLNPNGLAPVSIPSLTSSNIHQSS